MTNPRIVLIISGSIAAYKALELIRRARDRGITVRAVMTAGATRFITPLTVGALTGEPVFTDLFDLDREREIGHIRLARDCDLIVVAPATADLMAKMAGGHADDLATAVLLATDRPVLIAPAMNPFMWAHPATVRNAAQLAADGIATIGPNAGEMAERDAAGIGRMAEPLEILARIEVILGRGDAGALAGRHVLVTAGPTHEPIDPVRYIANRSSGKQGYAIAGALRDLGARVTLVSGPTGLASPRGVTHFPVETALEMQAAVRRALPADAAVFAAAVADWRVEAAAGQKIKKSADVAPATLTLVENPDILREVSAAGPARPALVVGFAAETERIVEHAQKKRHAKGCDWIVANDVSAGSGVMGGDHNTVHVITATGVDSWPALSKAEVAHRLAAAIAATLGPATSRSDSGGTA